MKTLRSPEEVINEFINGIDAMNDEQLAALLHEKCNFSNDLSVYDDDMSLVSKIPKENKEEYPTWLALCLLESNDEAIVILSRLAVKKYVTSFNLLLEALKGWLPCKNSGVSFINLPDYCDVFCVQYTDYDACENPREMMAFAILGGDESDPTWEFDETGFIQPYYRRGLSDFIYKLDGVLFDQLISAARIFEDRIEIELNSSYFAKPQMKGDGAFVPCFSNGNVGLQIGGSVCSAKKFGNKSRSLDVITIVASLT
jgi:hypothetical protein